MANSHSFAVIGPTWQSLANPGVAVPREITWLTGITPAMVRDAPRIADVMRALAGFLGPDLLAAHNAGFDGPFLAAEMAQVGHRPAADLICTLKLARRVYGAAPSYRLGTLVTHLRLDAEAGVHRALADAVAAARLLLRMREDLMARYGLPAVPADLLHALEGTPPCQADDWLRRTAAAEAARWLGHASQ